MSFEVIAGTYEQFLLGYSFTEKGTDLKQTFAIRSHTASIKCIHSLERYIATGGTDDRIFVYDLLTRKEHCMLTQHNASVTCVRFTPDRSHIVSGSSDGTLAIVRVGNWQLEKIWENTHKGAILNIAIHSSGKLALTLGSDRSLQTWNLVKGRQAYIINLMNKSKDPMSLEHLFWAPCGEKFVTGGGLYTEIWSIEKGGILKAIQHSWKVTSCAWLKDKYMIVGYENGNLGVVDTTSGEIEVKQCNSGRIKCITVHAGYIIMGCSDGNLIIWNKKFKEVVKVNTGCRITCLDVSSKKDLTENAPIEASNVNVEDNEQLEQPPKKKKKKKKL